MRWSRSSDKVNQQYVDAELSECEVISLIAGIRVRLSGNKALWDCRLATGIDGITKNREFHWVLGLR